MKDFLGRTIKVGCLVAYPGRAGSSCWITVARVVAFGTKKQSWSDKTEPTLTVKILKASTPWQKPRTSTIYALDRVLVVQEPDGEDRQERIPTAA